MALTILPSLMGCEGAMSTPQNIYMCRLPLSISTRPASDRPVYERGNIRATSPSMGNRGLRPSRNPDRSRRPISFNGSIR